MSRILSLFLPSLPTDRLLRRMPAEIAEPFATVAAVKGAQRIAAVDAKARSAAVRPGMGLADARAICPTLRVAEADPQGEAATLRHLVDWCRRFTPLAALDPPDGLFLDISGVPHLFGGEAALIAKAEAGLARQGFAAIGAVADTPEAAWALARYGDTRIAPPGAGAIRALAEPLPLAALRLESRIVEALAQAGLRRLGDVMMRPRAPIAARFGEALMARLDAVLGSSKTPIKPCFPVPLFLAERRFVTPITQSETVDATLLSLAGHLVTQLERAGQGARRLEALFFRVDGIVKEIALGTSRPLRDAPSLARLFREKLSSLGEDGLDTGYGFDLIRLGAVAVEPLRTQQPDLDPAAAVAAARAADLALLIDRLGARLGFTRVVRLSPTNRHRPEDAAIAVPALRAPALRAPALSTGAAALALDDDPDLSRPLRLFDRPEPITAVASVPDGPPVSFRWRRATHEITAIEGPERIAAPWWIDAAPVRDYFEAEDRDGRRYWLFREGIYGTGPTPPRWYVHGLFG